VTYLLDGRPREFARGGSLVQHEGAAMNEKRQQILIDPEVQVDLLWQATKYWFFCLLTVALFIFCWSIVTSENQGAIAIFNSLCFQYGPAAAASVIMLPLIYYDLLRVSHRFAGPIFKLRRELRKIAAGEKIGPIGFREDDYWHDLASDFNAALAKLQEGQQPSAVVEAAIAEVEPETPEETPLLTVPPDLIDLPDLRPEEPAEAVVAG
jgi:hypothetical protein